VNRRRIPPANVVILAAGALMLAGSFMAFYKVVAPNGTASFNAWDRGLFMIATLPALLGTVMALQILLVTFGNITMPNRVLGLTWDQFHVVVALQTFVLMLAHAAREPNLVGFPTELGTGFWVMFIGAIGLVVGALVRVATARRRPRAI